MTLRIFLPDYGSRPTVHGHQPMSTLYQGEDLRLCFYRDGPKYFPTAHEAREAAKEYVAGLINRMRAEPLCEPLPEIGQSTWRADQQAKLEAERTHLFAKGGRMVGIEHRHPRRQAGRARP